MAETLYVVHTHSREETDVQSSVLFVSPTRTLADQYLAKFTKQVVAEYKELYDEEIEVEHLVLDESGTPTMVKIAQVDGDMSFETVITITILNKEA